MYYKCFVVAFFITFQQLGFCKEISHSFGNHPQGFVLQQPYYAQLNPGPQVFRTSRGIPAGPLQLQPGSIGIQPSWFVAAPNKQAPTIPIQVPIPEVAYIRIGPDGSPVLTVTSPVYKAQSPVPLQGRSYPAQPQGPSFAQPKGQTYPQPQQGQSYAQSQGQISLQKQSQSSPQKSGHNYAQPQGHNYAQPQGQISLQKQSQSSPQKSGQNYAQPQGHNYAQPQGQSYAQPQGQSYAQPQGQSYSQKPKNPKNVQKPIQNFPQPQKQRKVQPAQAQPVQKRITSIKNPHSNKRNNQPLIQQQPQGANIPQTSSQYPGKQRRKQNSSFKRRPNLVKNKA